MNEGYVVYRVEDIREVFWTTRRVFWVEAFAWEAKEKDSTWLAARTKLAQVSTKKLAYQMCDLANEQEE